MTTQSLKTLVNTVIKQSTVDSTQITDPSQNFFLVAESKVEINSYKLAPNNHWEIQLTAPVKGLIKWFAYAPHVTLMTSPILETILEDIKNSVFNVYHRPTEHRWAVLDV